MEIHKVRQSIREIYAPPRFTFPRRPIRHFSLEDLFEIDSAVMSALADENYGYKYFILMVNTFSKFVYTEPVKTLTAREVCIATEKMMDRVGHKINYLYSDSGTEFRNSMFSAMTKKRNITHYFAYSEKKAPTSERNIKTIKMWLYKEMALNGTRVWVDRLQEITERKNNTPHDRFHFKPVDVNKDNEQLIYKKFYSYSRPLAKKIKFKLGDSVRILQKPATFKRAYDYYFSPQIFFIYSINKKFPPMFRIKNYKGDILRKSFYTEQLVKVKYDDIFLVEKVISRKKGKLKVRFWDYDSDGDAWVDAKDYMDLNVESKKERKKKRK